MTITAMRLSLQGNAGMVGGLVAHVGISSDQSTPAQAAAEHMIERGTGRPVRVSLVIGESGHIGQAQVWLP